MTQKQILLLSCLIGSMSGCTQSFNPKGPFDDRLVVHSILSTREPKLLVRIHKTYDVEGFNPLAQEEDLIIQGATVQLKSGNNSYLLRDTVLTRTDKTRYSRNIPSYVHAPFSLERGQTYELNISGAGKDASSSVTVPGPGSVRLLNDYVLDEEPGGQQLDVSIRLGGQTYAWMLRLLLVYTVQTDSGIVQRTIEIPSNRLEFDAALNRLVTVYPELQRTGLREAPRNMPALGMQYLQGARSLAYSSHPPGTVKIESVAFILTQVEKNLYRYYNVVNEFRDKRSIRLDEPDYSNISGGVGLFGAFTEDSLVIKLKSPPW